MNVLEEIRGILGGELDAEKLKAAWRLAWASDATARAYVVDHAQAAGWMLDVEPLSGYDCCHRWSESAQRTARPNTVHRVNWAMSLRAWKVLGAPLAGERLSASRSLALLRQSSYRGEWEISDVYRRPLVPGTTGTFEYPERVTCKPGTKLLCRRWKDEDLIELVLYGYEPPDEGTPHRG